MSRCFRLRLISPIWRLSQRLFEASVLTFISIYFLCAIQFISFLNHESFIYIITSFYLTRKLNLSATQILFYQIIFHFLKTLMVLLNFLFLQFAFFKRFLVSKLPSSFCRKIAFLHARLSVWRQNNLFRFSEHAPKTVTRTITILHSHVIIRVDAWFIKILYTLWSFILFFMSQNLIFLVQKIIFYYISIILHSFFKEPFLQLFVILNTIFVNS
jgi:hypothetical protein